MGWSGLYCLNDPGHADLDLLLDAYPNVTQVWRWVPTDLTSQFIADPNSPVEGQEWRVWRRGDPDNSSMRTMLPNHGYLIFLEGTTSQTLEITGRAILSQVDWRTSGANLIGFPADPINPPRLAGYLAAMPHFSATTNVYHYVGGPIGDGNPTRILNPTIAAVQRGKAYWIEVQAYSDYVSPIAVVLESGVEGLDFGTRGGPQTFSVTNRSSAALTVHLTPTASVPAPSGETPILAEVPLLQRKWDPDNQTHIFAPLTEALSVRLDAGERRSWTLVPDRSAMTGPPGSLYASVLQVTDGGDHGSYASLSLPVRAIKSTRVGLWVGEATITRVQNQLQRFQRDPDGANVIDEDGGYVLLDEEDAVTDTAQAFPLRLIIHVDEAENSRLLSNVYHGILDTDPAVLGFTSMQSALRIANLSRAVRVTATHLPLDVDQALSGTLEPGAQSTVTLGLPHDDPVNPFVHTYHPDHDNLDARFRSEPLEAGVESYAVTRAITLTVDDAAPDGDPTWGVSVLTGNYAETLSGLHKQPIAVEGRFVLRRLSEVGTLVR